MPSISKAQARAVRVVLTEMPPSANAMRSHFIDAGKVRSIKSKAYAEWKKAAAWEIAATRPGRISGPYRLSIAVQRDNIIKPISDALVAAGVVSDDSLAESVSAKWTDDLGGPAVVVLICAAERELAA